MRSIVAWMMPLALVTAAPSAWAGKAVKVIEPLAAGVPGNVTVVGTTVTVGDTAKPIADKLEAKAAEKRVAAKLTPYDPAATGARPLAAVYETLPLTAMLPLVVEDTTKDWGLTTGRPVRLQITIDTLKTANAGMAMLVGSNDELAGTVSVADAASGERLGEFYVDVLNIRAGMLGLAMRGSGVREKLAAEFSKHVAEQLNGGKKKKAKAA